MELTDSISIQDTISSPPSQGGAGGGSHITPAMVLSWLPRSATPAQQDSAIQSRFKPKEIRWSNRPDTLHLPGHDKGHNLLDTKLPQYYREGFFSKDSLFHPELPGGRYGMAGDPVPYTIHGDNFITSLLLICFIMAIISFANARTFIVRQLKSLFYLPHEGTSEINETANELRFQFLLVFLACVLIALLFYFYTINTFGDTFVLQTQYHLIGIYLGMVIAYITAKRHYYGKTFIEVASVLMFAVPGTVLGISYILGFNTKPFALTGTAAILVIVFIFRNMPVAIESGTTTLLQIDNSIEEASTILGADTGYSFRRITLPMLRNAFFSGLVYSFVKAITAVSAVIFLVSPRWNVITSKIYTLFDQAKYGQAAAFVTMMVVILLVFIGIFDGLIKLLLTPKSKIPQGSAANKKQEGE